MPTFNGAAAGEFPPIGTTVAASPAAVRPSGEELGWFRSAAGNWEGGYGSLGFRAYPWWSVWKLWKWWRMPTEQLVLWLSMCVWWQWEKMWREGFGSLWVGLQVAAEDLGSLPEMLVLIHGDIMHRAAWRLDKFWPGIFPLLVTYPEGKKGLARLSKSLRPSQLQGNQGKMRSRG